MPCNNFHLLIFDRWCSNFLVSIVTFYFYLEKRFHWQICDFIYFCQVWTYFDKLCRLPRKGFVCLLLMIIICFFFHNNQVFVHLSINFFYDVAMYLNIGIHFSYYCWYWINVKEVAIIWIGFCFVTEWIEL